MALVGLDEGEVVRILSMYVKDDGLTLGDRYGAQAVTAIEDVRELIRAYLHIHGQNQSLWQDFEDAPEANSAELTGLLEDFIESDPGFATRLNALYQEFVLAGKRSEVAAPEFGDPDVVINDDVELA